MPHCRRQVRTAVVSALAGIPVKGGVEATRILPTDTADLPKVLVYVLAEQITPVNKSAVVPRLLRRVMTVQVEALVSARASAMDDKLDDLGEEIEARMAADPTLGGVVSELDLTATAISLDERGSIGSLLMTYSATARTDEGRPSIIVK